MLCEVLGAGKDDKLLQIMKVILSLLKQMERFPLISASLSLGLALPPLSSTTEMNKTLSVSLSEHDSGSAYNMINRKSEL